MFKAAVFCESNFENRTWKPDEKVMCVAIFGAMNIDFRQAQLEPGVTRIICINVFGATRFHEDVQTFTPCSRASAPRYWPHSQTAITVSTGHGVGSTPSDS